MSSEIRTVIPIKKNEFGQVVSCDLSNVGLADENQFFFKKTELASDDPDADYSQKQFLVELADKVVHLAQHTNDESNDNLPENFVGIIKKGLNNPFSLSSVEKTSLLNALKISKIGEYDLARAFTLLSGKNEKDLFDLKREFLSYRMDSKTVSFLEEKVAGITELEHKMLCFIERESDSLINLSNEQIFGLLAETFFNSSDAQRYLLTTSDLRAIRLSIISWLQKVSLVRLFIEEVTSKGEKETAEELLGIKLSGQPRLVSDVFGISIFLDKEDLVTFLKNDIGFRMNDAMIRVTAGANIDVKKLRFKGSAVPAIITLVGTSENKLNEAVFSRHEKQHTVFDHMHRIDSYSREKRKGKNIDEITERRIELEETVKDEFLARLSDGSTKGLPTAIEAYNLDGWFGNDIRGSFYERQLKSGDNDGLDYYYFCEESLILLRNVLHMLSYYDYFQSLVRMYPHELSDESNEDSGRKYLVALISNVPANKFEVARRIALKKISSTDLGIGAANVISTEFGVSTAYHKFPQLSDLLDHYKQEMEVQQEKFDF